MVSLSSEEAGRARINCTRTVPKAENNILNVDISILDESMTTCLRKRASI